MWGCYLFSPYWKAQRQKCCLSQATAAAVDTFLMVYSWTLKTSFSKLLQHQLDLTKENLWILLEGHYTLIGRYMSQRFRILLITRYIVGNWPVYKPSVSDCFLIASSDQKAIINRRLGTGLSVWNGRWRKEIQNTSMYCMHVVNCLWFYDCIGL